MATSSELSAINPTLAQRKFYRVNCADNGIGFDKVFVTKIFRIFQRLHSQGSEYDGKGIGLAICQRIMANHAGYITADGEPGRGATFSLYFPVEA
jgi:light-regulated signal transduction histidine kinase (bacteriophytochrome)